MDQLPLFQTPTSWSVTEINRYLKELLESDHNLADVWVKGEISNLSQPRSGHIYFTLKDSTATLRCVMWRTAAARLLTVPRDGESVEVHGYISLYEAGGQYQLYADRIRSLGEGALYQEFLQLQSRLEDEGLFDPSRKRPIPPRPVRIGIVTSPSGAALRDILNTIRRRYPLVDIILAPTPVQGVEAPAGIIKALHILNSRYQPDVILVSRGGGSIEDLWAFNHEAVARAIADSQAPVISGVGHQTDFTISDFVADLRAPTPTAAAELATPDRTELKLNLSELSQRMVQVMLSQTSNARWAYSDLVSRLAHCSPSAQIQTDRQRLDDLTHRMTRHFSHILKLQGTRLAGFERRLNALNPHAILARGFAIVSQPDGTIIRRINQVDSGNRLNVHLVDGQFPVQVIKESDE